MEAIKSLNSHLMGKIPNHTPNRPPTAVCEVKLNYLHIYICTQSLLIRIFNKELHTVLFLEEYVECISYLGECVQPMPLVVIYCL
jgi:hypothetical protein